MLHPTHRRVGMLAEVFHPQLLERAVVLGRLHQVEEALDGAVEPLLKDGRGDPAGGSKAWCACARENRSGYMRAPRCSSGIRRDQSPRLPPAIEGDAERSMPCRPLKGWGAHPGYPVYGVLQAARH
jgi:hypothetical protein